MGPFEILAPLGAGGMGEVYRARDLRLERAVAIKILPEVFSENPGRLRRFEQEARSASALNHPNIVTIYELGQDGCSHFIAMELVEGQTLRQLMSAGPLAMRKTIEIAAQVADGLTKAHEAGITHRDLKPENVMEERAAAKRAHAAYCLVLSEEEAAERTSAEGAEWLGRMAAEHDNFRAALEWLTEAGDADWGLRMATALFRFWEIREYLAEGRDRLGRLLKLPGAAGATKLRTRALFAAGVLAGEQGDYASAEALIRESQTIAGQLGDKTGVAVSLNALAVFARDRGNVATAHGLFEESLELWERVWRFESGGSGAEQFSERGEITGRFWARAGVVWGVLEHFPWAGRSRRNSVVDQLSRRCGTGSGRFGCGGKIVRGRVGNFSRDRRSLGNCGDVGGFGRPGGGTTRVRESARAVPREHKNISRVGA